MVRVKEKPGTPPRARYEEDVFSWSFEQAELLRSRRFADLDVENIVEEIESLGNEQIHALESQYQRLIHHLLKWQFQPTRRSASWQISIADARAQIKRREKRNRKLAKDAWDIASSVYDDAVKLACLETGLPGAAFPAECPYTMDKLRDPDWLPEGG